MIFNRVFKRDGIVLQLKIYHIINYNNNKILNIKRKRYIKVNALKLFTTKIINYRENIYKAFTFIERPIRISEI